MTRKYKITESLITRRGEIARLERDGFDRSAIIKAMYKVTDGANDRERNKIVGELFDRQAK